MADGSLYVRGMSLEQARQAMDAWQADHERIDVDVREAYSDGVRTDSDMVGIDVFAGTDEEIERILTSLVPLFDQVESDVYLPILAV